MIKNAKKFNLEDYNDNYKRASAAAKECGLETQYEMKNKLLSKFAHPTALTILSVSDSELLDKQCRTFFAFGCLYFCTAFNELENYVDQLCDAARKE